MAIDPTVPQPWSWVPPEWDAFGGWNANAPVNLAPAPPPVPPPALGIAAPNVPTTQEVPVSADIPRLSDAEDAQLEIHPPAEPLMPRDEENWDTPPRLVPRDEGVLTPPMLGEVDAVTGGLVPGQVDRILGRTTASGQTTATPSQTPDDYMTGEELGVEMSGRSAEEQAMFLAKIEGARSNFAATKALENSERARTTAEANARRREEMVKAANQRALELDAEAKQLADMTPLDKLTGGQALAGVIAALVGGLASSHSGGKGNLALDAVSKIAGDAAQRNAAKMQLNRQQRAGVGEQVAAAEDTYRVAETVRLATWDAAEKALQTEVQQFDPRGATAQRLMGAIGEIKARRAEAAQREYDADLKRRQQQFENDIKYGELGVKVGELDLKKKAQAAKLAGGGGAGKAAKPGDVVQPPEYFEALYGKRPPISMSQNGYEEWAKTGKVTQELIKAERENSPEERNRASVIAAPPQVAVDEAGNVTVKRSAGNLKQEDGRDWIPNTPDEAKAFRTKKAAADSIVEILDEIRVIRDRSGGASEWGNSDDYLRLKVLKNNLTIIAKSGTEGMSSDEDMKKIDAALGASNPASFRAQAAGLDEGRKRVERRLNVEATNLGYNGKPITYTDPLKQAKAAKTTEQSGVERVLAFDLNDAKRQESYASELGIAGGSFARGNASERADALSSALKSAGGILPSIKQEIDTLRETAGDENAKPKAREFARESLDRIARESESETVRNYALANSFQMPAPPREEVE